jgi:hypothetical protein
MEQKSSLIANIVHILAWLICSVLALVDLLVIREAALVVMTAIRAQRIEASEVGQKVKTQIDFASTIQAVDTSIIILGMVIVAALAIGIEVYFRLGKAKGKLYQRIGIVLGIEVAIFIVCVLIQTFV